MEPIDTELMQQLKKWFTEQRELFGRFREMKQIRERLMNESRLVVCENLLWTEPSHYTIATLRSEPDEV